jgi:S-adenosylmethionine hydrolase
MALVTLTTDFGNASPYAAAMKGALLSINPAATIVDLSHLLPPQDVRFAAYFLAESMPYFPSGTIHIAVVDPGVGTDRQLLLVQAGEQFQLAPDNGILSFALAELGAPTIRKLTESRFWRSNPSTTFHGRDILAPVAAHLALGTPPAEFGPVVTNWNRLVEPSPTVNGAMTLGEVVYIDSFGNLITNIRRQHLPRSPGLVSIGQRTEIPLVRTYGDAQPGSIVALVGSSGRLEISRVNGSAAQFLGINVEAVVGIGSRLL